MGSKIFKSIKKLFQNYNVPIAVLLIFIVGHILDSITTIIGLFYPPRGTEFVEVGNVFIKYFIYDLKMGKTGFFIGDFFTWVFEIAYIYARAHQINKVNIAEFLSLLVMFGIVHWIGGISNLISIYSAMQNAPLVYNPLDYMLWNNQH